MNTFTGKLTPWASSNISLAKSFLLLQVIIVHCLPVAYEVAGVSPILDKASGAVGLLIECGIRLFFSLSGYLFFVNISKFNFSVYKKKLRSRIYTLLIPYILWNTIYGVVRILKAKFLGFDGDGIIVDGHFSLMGFIRGYWDTGHLLPMGYPLWFIRNLIVFQIFTPIVFVIVRSRWLTLAAILAPFFGVTCYGAEFFVFGAALGFRRVDLNSFCHRHVILLNIILVVVATVLAYNYICLVLILQYIGFLLLIPLCVRLRELMPKVTGFVLRHSDASFFIFAVHGLFNAIICRTFVRITGPENLWWLPLWFLLSLITIILLSVLCFKLTALISPKLLNLLSGMRIGKHTENWDAKRSV